MVGIVSAPVTSVSVVLLGGCGFFLGGYRILGNPNHEP